MLEDNPEIMEDSQDSTIETQWKNPPTVSDLKQDLEAAMPFQHSHLSRVENWRSLMHVEGNNKPKTGKNRSSVQPKMIRKQAEWRYPALSEPFLNNEKMFNASPRTWEDRNGAHKNEILLNYQFNTYIDKVTFIDEYVRSAVDEGTVIVKVGWNREEVTETELVPEYTLVENPQMIEIFEEVAVMYEESPSDYLTKIPEELKVAFEHFMETGELMEVAQIDYEEQEVTKVVANHPTAEIIDIDNFYVDFSGRGDTKKANFAIHSFETSLSELKKDGRYKNLDKINLENASIVGTAEHKSQGDSSFNFKDKPRKRFVAYEYWGYWDIDGSGIVKPIVATWVGSTLIRLEDNPFPDKQLPFVIVPYLPIKKSFYGEADAELLEDNQKIVGAVTRGIIDLLGKSANGQTGFAKNFLDVTNRRKYDRGEDYQFNPVQDVRSAIFTHQYPQIPGSAFDMIGLQNNEAESLTGVKAFNSGLTGDALGSVATSVRGVLDAASKREVAILRRLAKGIKDIGRKFVSMNAEFLEEEEYVRITNEHFEPIQREELAGQYDLKLAISTAEEDNAKVQNLSFLLQTMGNTVPLEVIKILLAEITELSRLPDAAEQIKRYQPEPDPLAQEEAMLRIELLKAQIAQTYAGAEEKGSKAQLAPAKFEAEMAKARKLMSEADTKDLDFIEQESGVKQERDLQKIREQAESNTRRDLVKSRLDSQKQQMGALNQYLQTR